jgi:hypothetical protein
MAVSWPLPCPALPCPSALRCSSLLCSALGCEMSSSLSLCSAPASGIPMTQPPLTPALPWRRYESRTRPFLHGRSGSVSSCNRQDLQSSIVKSPIARIPLYPSIRLSVRLRWRHFSGPLPGPSPPLLSLLPHFFSSVVEAPRYFIPQPKAAFSSLHANRCLPPFIPFPSLSGARTYPVCMLLWPGDGVMGCSSGQQELQITRYPISISHFSQRGDWLLC